MADHSIPGPPPGRKNVPVHLTEAFRDDLAILMRNGARASDAIRAAVRDRADAYRRAWEYADVTPDQDPQITGCTYKGEFRPPRWSRTEGSDA